jgi:hypothetical protein
MAPLFLWLASRQRYGFYFIWEAIVCLTPVYVRLTTIKGQIDSKWRGGMTFIVIKMALGGESGRCMGEA